ncbi:MAG: 3-isopropylmalate dehydratase small subunit [Burkholderiaceae bacterium]|mgnify:CR=1 FL=1|jgi:3-isopropylmalate/(R)-2-methylmalate dehydratase small subunit|nr:3-isopropylmalate dehydratase small subunit [Burkholderiaceae bacterium]MDP4969349.1 3-isopropylmalate dehydratase small subunit [Burkholderiaceae bacterium]MDP5111338.1 3-isopropylmalate dehydratase small subunit [Burkholderiaceae bacterium]
MTPFMTLDGLAAPLEGRNVDTDQIIPARFLKKRRGEYADYLFYDLRFDAQQRPREDFVLNQAGFQSANVLVCDENFGCGSSREAAVYAMVDFGIKSILAPSFGDIFYNNCLKNGVLPIVLPATTLKALRLELTKAAHTNTSAKNTPASGCHDGLSITIDLKECTVACGYFKQPMHFEIDPFWQECLMKGVDEIALTLGYSEQIQQYEQKARENQPWLAP